MDACLGIGSWTVDEYTQQRPRKMHTFPQERFSLRETMSKTR
jgi:3-methyladenine DNA glycosylase/8-oxoguanine DNA glycosylase